LDDKMEDSGLSSKIKTAGEAPVFSRAQQKAFFSDYVDSLDEALAVLDETNKTTVGHTGSFEENKKE